jgi:hypothetical protein
MPNYTVPQVNTNTGQTPAWSNPAGSPWDGVSPWDDKYTIGRYVMGAPTAAMMGMDLSRGTRLPNGYYDFGALTQEQMYGNPAFGMPNGAWFDPSQAPAGTPPPPRINSGGQGPSLWNQATTRPQVNSPAVPPPAGTGTPLTTPPQVNTNYPTGTNTGTGVSNPVARSSNPNQMGIPGNLNVLARNMGNGSGRRSPFGGSFARRNPQQYQGY